MHDFSHGPWPNPMNPLQNTPFSNHFPFIIFCFIPLKNSLLFQKSLGPTHAILKNNPFSYFSLFILIFPFYFQNRFDFFAWYFTEPWNLFLQQTTFGFKKIKHFHKRMHEFFTWGLAKLSAKCYHFSLFILVFKILYRIAFIFVWDDKHFLLNNAFPF